MGAVDVVEALTRGQMLCVLLASCTPQVPHVPTRLNRTRVETLSTREDLYARSKDS